MSRSAHTDVRVPLAVVIVQSLRNGQEGAARV